MKQSIEKLRRKYMDNPPEGMTSEDIRHMLRTCHRRDPAGQEPADSAGEVSRTDHHGYPLSSEIYGSYYECGGEGHLYQAFPHYQGDSQFPG